ncbi:MAG: prepilin-type N-terminal cleavage/methylation domain-containing protein [Pseudomonadota bacterium]
MKKCTQAQAGFTLIEAIMVMTITAVLAAGVAVFLRKPIDGYMDLARRTELSDIADTAVRRISRDLHLALPNSVRADSGPLCLEFIPTINGGRYRADVDGAGGGNVFSTATLTNQFDVLGQLSAAPAVNDRVVVYNLGIPGADAYRGDNIATIDAATTTLIHWTPSSFQFPFTSPGNRFHIIPAAEPTVTYVCSGVGSSGGNGSGVLYRYTGYAPSPAQDACPATPPAGTPKLAQNLSACSFTYVNGVAERSGLVSIRLAITRQNETVNLYHEVHVNNVP